MFCCFYEVPVYLTKIKISGNGYRDRVDVNSLLLLNKCHCINTTGSVTSEVPSAVQRIKLSFVYRALMNCCIAKANYSESLYF